MVWVTSAVILTLFWSVAFGFLFLDLTGSLRRYKVQPGTNEPVEKRKLIEVIIAFKYFAEFNNCFQAFFTIIFNQMVVSITFSSGGEWK